MIKRYSIARIEDFISLLKVPPTTGNTLLKGRLVSKTITIQRDLGDHILQLRYRLYGRTVGQISLSHFQDMLNLCDDIKDIRASVVETTFTVSEDHKNTDYSLIEEAVQLKAKIPYSYHPRSPIPSYELVNDKYGVWCLIFDSK